MSDIFHFFQPHSKHSVLTAGEKSSITGDAVAESTGSAAGHRGGRTPREAAGRKKG
jgi:hypothetical protein